MGMKAVLHRHIWIHYPTMQLAFETSPWVTKLYDGLLQNSAQIYLPLKPFTTLFSGKRNHGLFTQYVALFLCASVYAQIGVDVLYFCS